METSDKQMGCTAEKSVKKKILFLLEAFDKGGIEKVTLDIVNHLDPEKYDITVQTFWYGGHCQSLVNDNVKVIPFFFKRYVRGIIRLIQYLPPRMLYKLFVHGDYDVEIAASDGGAAKVISGSTNKKARKICWVHMDVIQQGSKLMEFANVELARQIYCKFDKICCVSKPCLEQFMKKFGTFSDMLVVQNPLPTDEIRQKAKEFNPYGEAAGVCQFVTVGRLVREKGYDRLIESCHRLVSAGMRGFQLHIVGDGIQARELEEQINLYQLQKYVILEGFKENPFPYVAYADWYVCSSRNEAYPLTVGESIVLHTPVIGTACSGILAWLGKNEFGLVQENSIDGIIKGLKTALEMSCEEYDLWKEKTAQKAAVLNFAQQLKAWESSILAEKEEG